MGQALQQAGVAYLAGDWAKAEMLCRSILTVQAGEADALNLLAAITAQTGRTQEAATLLGRAVAAKPHDATVHNNYGNVLSDLKRFDAALESYERALKLKPDFAEAHYNGGNALMELKRFAEAVDRFERALKLKADSAEAHYNRGNALRELKRLDEALESYGSALQIKPDFEWAYGVWLHTKMQLCHWGNLDADIAELAAKIKNAKHVTPPFPVVTILDSVSLQRRAAEICVRVKHPPARLLAPIGKRARREKIRLGYYSADYHDHATASLVAELFERHDRSRFELVGFSFGPDHRGEMRTRLAAAFDRFVDVRTHSDSEVAQLSRQLEIDIAVDLKGFTQNPRPGIFSHRAAPLQVNYLGYPGTMGAPYIDYLIADRTLIPEEARNQYQEKIVYLPNSYQANDRKRPIAEPTLSRAELGLQATGFVFCCFNASYKITPASFAGWMRILRQTEGSVLWLLDDNATAANNLRTEAEARGVSAARLIFAPRMPLAQHLARHRAADLFLDTLPCNAHTTASDALWAGLPVLTRTGESFAARVAASLLNAIGLPELIATTQDQYEALAIELASNPARLARLREALSNNRLSAPLFDTTLFTRHIEDAYTQMYQRYQADLPPEHILVPP